MFEIYKRGQGTVARWLTAGGLGALAAFGAYELQDWLSGRITAPITLAGTGISVSVLISGLAFVAAAVLIGLLVNQPRFVDYLIMSEVELRKVSWPTRDELRRQTTVVIITVVFFALVLLVADTVFGLGSMALYGF